ncbi:MAG: hypothetical protein Q4C80_04115 [Bacillota bacterium]|nr:hypothetical protein [Bacillota bacterium]
MQDVSQELYKKIREEFNSKVNKDSEIIKIRKKIEAETADLGNISLYARRLGELASETLIDCLDEDKLPNGILYWNIAERTILPLLKNVHEIVNEAAITVQKNIDTKSGIGINSIPAPFPEERAKALIQKIVDISIKEAE